MLAHLDLISAFKLDDIHSTVSDAALIASYGLVTFFEQVSTK
jgi:hypothetical protein